MFDIGFTELLIVAVVALIVLGPERLPGAVRTVGLWIGRIRRTVSNVQREVAEELRMDELRQSAEKQKNELERQVEDLERPFNETLRDEILTPSGASNAGDAPVQPQVDPDAESQAGKTSAEQKRSAE
jgi:sec-independent protein translocase protein TatB